LPEPAASLPLGSREGQVAKGILFMLLAMTLLPSMNGIAKHLAADYPMVQVVWARFAGHLAAMTILFWPKLGPALYRTRRPRLQFVRSCIMFVSNTAFIAALPAIQLATASAIMFTAPLMVTALSVPLLGERVGWRRWSAVAVGFLGMLVIVRPGADLALAGGLLVLVSATCFAFYQILTRRLAPYDPPETTIVYTALVAAVAMTCALPFDSRLPDPAIDYLLFAVMGTLGGLGQYFVIKALQYAPVSVAAPFTYTELIWAATIGYLVFGALPDALTWTGAAIIVGSGIYIVFRETRLARARRR
jgi:drug/metabolite transporter (DMT)-like permease